MKIHSRPSIIVSQSSRDACEGKNTRASRRTSSVRIKHLNEVHTRKKARRKINGSRADSARRDSLFLPWNLTGFEKSLTASTKTVKPRNEYCLLGLVPFFLRLQHVTTARELSWCPVFYDCNCCAGDIVEAAAPNTFISVGGVYWVGLCASDWFIGAVVEISLKQLWDDTYLVT